MSDTRPVHSPLGASSAERWMNCPGSVRLARLLQIPEPTDESDYRAEGTAAHEIAASAMAAGMDAWEFLGEVASNGVAITMEIVEGVQVFLDVCRTVADRADKWGVEEHVTAPTLHPLFYGTTDFWAWTEADRLLDVIDYKNGAGVVVEVEENPQAMYYAYGVLRNFPLAKRVRLRIVQPNAFHPDGQVRAWEISSDALRRWAETVLAPAMDRTDTDDSLVPGDHCRFCPAKLSCPVMRSMFGAAAKDGLLTDAGPARVMSDDELGRNYALIGVVRSYLRALEDETLRRWMAGGSVPETKLVAKRADRVWKGEAETVLAARLGGDIYSKPELRSPAQVEKISPEAKALVHEWAYTPQTGYTVAPEGDKRSAVTIPSAAATFAHMAEGTSP